MLPSLELRARPVESMNVDHVAIIVIVFFLHIHSSYLLLASFTEEPWRNNVVNKTKRCKFAGDWFKTHMSSTFHK